MTEENEYFAVDRDEDYVPVVRTVSPLGSAWSFDAWDSQKEEWKNHPSYQVLNGYTHKMKTHGNIFKEIRTGCILTMSQKKKEQECQQESLDKVKLPIVWGVKGLVDDCFYFVYKDKTLEK